MPELVSGDQGSSPSPDANQLGEDTPLSGPQFFICEVGQEWENQPLKGNQPLKVLSSYPSFQSVLPQLWA